MLMENLLEWFLKMVGDVFHGDSVYLGILTGLGGIVALLAAPWQRIVANFNAVVRFLGAVLKQSTPTVVSAVLAAMLVSMFGYGPNEALPPSMAREQVQLVVTPTPFIEPPSRPVRRAEQPAQSTKTLASVNRYVGENAANHHGESGHEGRIHSNGQRLPDIGEDEVAKSDQANEEDGTTSICPPFTSFPNAPTACNII